MTFYVKPPSGRIVLRVIEEGMSSRLNFLMSIYDNKPTETQEVNVEHLFENSALDNVSHFMLRICCLFSPEFQKFLIQSETKLFEKRLSYYDISSIRTMLLILQKHLAEIIPAGSNKDKSRLHLITGHICADMLKRNVLKHAFSRQHNDGCREFTIKVPFIHCSALVRRREVELRKGLCHVHCGAWVKLLSCFFQSLLLHGIEQLTVSTVSQEVDNDVRIKSLIFKTLHKFSKKWNYCSDKSMESTNIKAAEVDKESEFFPACAFNLLHSLRSKHRVGHHARIQLSLFLKGIGMDVGEAIEFWKEEYSKNPCAKKDNSITRMVNDSCQSDKKSSVCSHSWKKDSSRYLYNIQHLYGLQGSCKNYQSPSCSTLQSATMNGEGCPFAKLNASELVKVLPPIVLKCSDLHNEAPNTSLKKIMDLACQGKPREACQTCFAAHRNALLVHKSVQSQSVGINEHCVPKIGNSLIGSGNRQEKKSSQLKQGFALREEGEIKFEDEHTHVCNKLIVNSCVNSNFGTTERNMLEDNSRRELIKKISDLSSMKESDAVQNFMQENFLQSPIQYYLALKSRGIEL